MTTNIIHCGFVDPAKQDPIEALLALMASEPLEPWLAPFEDTRADGVSRFGGNFFTTSFAFTIHTDELALIARLRAAIAANIARPEYAEAKRLRAEHDAARAAALTASRGIGDETRRGGWRRPAPRGGER